jgi:hypothetical protein
VRRNQCDGLVEEMQRAWRGSRTLPHPDAWRSTLMQMDAALAAEAVARLVGRSSAAPSIAEFRATYRQVEEAKLWRPQARKRCSECEGTGWVTGPPQRYEPSRSMLAAHEQDRRAALSSARTAAIAAGVEFDPSTVRWEPPACEYTTVVPCLHCAAGKRAEAALEGK